MKKTILIIATALLCLFLSVTAQVTKSTYQPVKIGDRIPDVILTNIYNYKTTQTNLSDFQVKLIILDFWATWCYQPHRLSKEYIANQHYYKAGGLISGGSGSAALLFFYQ